MIRWIGVISHRQAMSMKCLISMPHLDGLSTRSGPAEEGLHGKTASQNDGNDPSEDETLLRCPAHGLHLPFSTPWSRQQIARYRTLLFVGDQFSSALSPCLFCSSRLQPPRAYREALGNFHGNLPLDVHYTSDLRIVYYTNQGWAVTALSIVRGVIP